MHALLEVKDLQISFFNGREFCPAVDGVSFDVYEGETLCIVGESGSGKTVTSLAVMRLLAVPPAKYSNGSICYLGQNLLALDESAMRKLRGRDISMIFQEPMTSLNPVLTIGEQIIETMIAHQQITRKEAQQKAIQMLTDVGVPDPQRRIHEYPHQMSGGMRQRMMIAIALSCRPKLLIADEPTTALDVTIQAQILQLMKKLKQQYGMTIMFITHDLGVVAQVADRVLVLYAGKVMEQGRAREIFSSPQHPYTRGLMNCMPRLDQKMERLKTIEGIVPALKDLPAGCRFSTRCPFCTPLCQAETPQMRGEAGGHMYRCQYTPEERVRKTAQEGGAGQ